MPALLFMVVFMLAICSQHSMPARLLMFMLAVEVHACTDITGHAHACCLSTTLLTARLCMFMPLPLPAVFHNTYALMLAGAPPPSAWSSPAPRRVPRLYVTTAIPSIISRVMLMPGVWPMPAQFFMFMLTPGVWRMPAQFYGHGHAHAHNTHACTVCALVVAVACGWVGFSHHNQ